MRTAILLGGVYLFVLSSLFRPYFGALVENIMEAVGAILMLAVAFVTTVAAKRHTGKWRLIFSSTANKRFFIWVGAILVLLIVSALQAILYDAGTVNAAISRVLMAAEILLVSAYVLGSMPYADARKAFWITVTLLPVFCVVAVLMYFLLAPIYGAPSTSVRAYSYLGQLLGMPILRQSFLDGGGLTYLAELAACSIGFLLLGVIQTRAKTKMHIVILVVSMLVGCSYVLVLSDGRAAVGALIVALACATFGKRIVLRHPVSILILLSSIVPLFMFIASALPPSDLSFLSRDASGLELANNPRWIMWGSFFDLLSTADPRLIFGYGVFGQANSGLSSDYAFLFNRWDAENPLQFSLHNLILQLIIELGIVGLVIVFAAIYFVLVRARNIQSEHPVETCMLVYLIAFTLVVGGIDNTGSPARKEFFFYFWSLAAIFMSLPKKRPSDRHASC